MKKVDAGKKAAKIQWSRALTGWRRAIRLLRSAPIMPLLVIAVIIVCAIFAPFIAPRDPMESNTASMLVPPLESKGGVTYILGSDEMGRDILSRVIWGARISLIVALVAIVIGGAVGTVLGLISGFYGGKVDMVIMRVTDTMLAMPYMLIAIVVVGIMGPSLTNVILVIAVVTWARYARMIRGEVLTIKGSDFVALGVIAGCSKTRLLLRHIFPNVVNTLIILATLEVGRVIIFESSLSFLGMGVPPPTPTWGFMLSKGKDYITQAWWLSTLPGLAIVLTVLAVNLLGDWLRDWFDPLRRQRA